MSLDIAVLSHLRHPVAPPFAGGMEAHTWHLVHGLAARGHRVTLYASGDSSVGVPLQPIVPTHYESRLPWHEHRQGRLLRSELTTAYTCALNHIRRSGADVVHNNTVHPLPIEQARRHRVPMLTTLHVPPFDALAEAVRDTPCSWLNYSVPSQRQHDVWWSRSCADAHIVHNGIALTDWPFEPIGDGTAVWAGRIAPNKGTQLAALAALRANVPLALWGPVEDREYFETRVKPLLGDTVRYAGHGDATHLGAAFRRASVLLFTPLWEEPFGLVAVEAMASGLPVAATDRGAAREVIADAGRFAAGADLDTDGQPTDACVDALAEALRQALDIAPAVPRRRVETLFSHDAALTRYERLYAECIAGAGRVAA